MISCSEHVGHVIVGDVFFYAQTFIGCSALLIYGQTWTCRGWRVGLTLHANMSIYKENYVLCTKSNLQCGVSTDFLWKHAWKHIYTFRRLWIVRNSLYVLCKRHEKFPLNTWLNHLNDSNNNKKKKLLSLCKKIEFFFKSRRKLQNCNFVSYWISTSCLSTVTGASLAIPTLAACLFTAVR